MRVLALEPYLGGSHQAFLDGWRKNSRHDWTVLGLPPYKWKWRMRHAAVTLARQVVTRDREGERWDVLWASDMLNLAEFVGLIPERVRKIPRVAYFHENQLTYPNQRQDARDYHFAFTNFTTALTADQSWFNSDFHQNEFLGALRNFLARMPDFQPLEQVDQIAESSVVQYPGVDSFLRRPVRLAGPLRVLWSARWEHDKNPAVFFEAMRLLKLQSVDFRLNVVGQSFGQTPAVFDWAREYLADRIDHWGYVDSRADYAKVLENADIIVSTALHEFFGIGVVEALAAGAFPMLPARLAYPEILHLVSPCPQQHLYDGSCQQLASSLRRLAADIERGSWSAESALLQQAAGSVFGWKQRGMVMDGSLDELVSRPTRHRYG